MPDFHDHVDFTIFTVSTVSRFHRKGFQLSMQESHPTFPTFRNFSKLLSDNFFIIPRRDKDFSENAARSLFLIVSTKLVLVYNDTRQHI